MYSKLPMSVVLVLFLSLAICVGASAKDKPKSTLPELTDSKVSELTRQANATSLFLNADLIPEVGTGLFPGQDLHDCAAFFIHGLIGEAGWYYQGKGHHGAMLWAGNDSGHFKYVAVDEIGKQWLFVFSAGELFENKEHEVWIDDDPTDSTPPEWYEWVLEAK
jgi:hypothetical protein